VAVCRQPFEERSQAPRTEARPRTRVRQGSSEYTSRTRVRWTGNFLYRRRRAKGNNPHRIGASPGESGSCAKISTTVSGLPASVGAQGRQ